MQIPICVFVCVFLVTGCGASRPKLGGPGCENPPTRINIAARVDEAEQLKNLKHRIFQSLIEPHIYAERGRDLLALSGGGQWGAFGAGYLTGLGEANPDGLQFRVVTGISTGAILSTFAFIGDHTQLIKYTEITDKDIIRKRFLLSLLFQDGIYDLEPLRQLLDDMIDDSVLKRVALRADTGAILVVGTVNLDTGALTTIYLSDLARDIVQGRVTKSRYIDAILASSAIPVAFAPIYIDCQMHVDGGARHQIFLDAVVGATKNNEKPSVTSSPASNSPPTVYGLVNGTMRLDTTTVAPRIISIGERSLQVLLDSNLDSDIRHLCMYDQKEYSVRVISADGTKCTDILENDSLFQTSFMKCLYNEGISLAKSGGQLSLLGEDSVCKKLGY